MIIVGVLVPRYHAALPQTDDQVHVVRMVAVNGTRRRPYALVPLVSLQRGATETNRHQMYNMI